MQKLTVSACTLCGAYDRKELLFDKKPDPVCKHLNKEHLGRVSTCFKIILIYLITWVCINVTVTPQACMLSKMCV